MTAKQALGRGLKALIPDTPRARTGMAEIPVDRLQPNPQQPRQIFDETAIEELTASILRHGVLQPLLVSEDGPDRYRIITGERRWRAARRAGLRVVPAVIRERLETHSSAIDKPRQATVQNVILERAHFAVRNVPAVDSRNP
ncbi:MAG: ParB/RepB/Spo0J family partition protein, partial [Thermoanaerobaculales bacterium]|nr:ParB/RepB/Spo0J family partition protein [Thermoanaerobaculales bacterium]